MGKTSIKKIGIVDIKKKSFPLPRDIVGRILIRIDPKIFSELTNMLLENTETDTIYKAIDVIGHISYTYKDYSMEKILIEYYRKNKTDEFMEWKIIRAFQSFDKSEEIENILEGAIKTHKNKIITEEAKRSSRRIKESRLA